jgi:long-subunit fatty acid transport protein
MKSKCSILYLLVTVLALAGMPAQAQYIEDALRLGLSGTGVGTRSLGMGNAYTGVANDYSAIYWNPAGLAQMEFSEFSFGLSHFMGKDNASILNTQQEYSYNATNLNALGLAYKIPTTRGSMVIAFGYNRQNNFVSGMSYSAYNPNNSIIQTYAPNGSLYPSDISNNIAYQLYLADVDTVTGRWDSPIVGKVLQTAKVVEGGGLNNWSIAGGLEIAKNLSLGVTLTYLSGSYTYDRTLVEEDRDNAYNSTFRYGRNNDLYDFKRLNVDEYVDGDISGGNAKFGLMYRIPDRFRLGVAIKTPTSFTVKENWGTTARSTFDNGDIFPVDADLENTGMGQYDVSTPWEFNLGASVILKDLTVSGDVTYTDWTELKFENANSDVLALNKDIKTLLRGTRDYRAGLEYDIVPVGVRLRGGFMYFTSPYENDPKTFDQKYITGGLGILLGPSTMLDLAYAHGWWETYRSNSGSGRSNEQITSETLRATLSYRF